MGLRYYVTYSVLRRVPDAVFRFDPDNNISERYSKRRGYWIYSGWIVSQLIGGGITKNDEVDESTAMDIIRDYLSR